MKIKKILLIFLIALIGSNCNFVFGKGKSNPDTCEILLIGSSYFNFNNLAVLLKHLADSSGDDIYIEMYGQNGLYLADHAASSGTESKINERDWDYVVLQGVGILVAYPEHFSDHPVYPALVTLKDKIQENCPSTKMVFCMPWAFEDGMTWYQDWTDTYEDMQIHIYNNTLQYSDEIGFEIAPVGWAWYAVLEEYNYPLHYLHMSDWNHPSLRGSYLMACVIYSTVLQESTVNNPYHAGIPEEEADFFQAVASDTVLNNLELWNITPFYTFIENSKDENEIHLYQCYPNPFGSTTTITYSIQKEGKVNLIIFDALGRKIDVVVNEHRNPGQYWLQFDASGLPDGIYYCRLTAGNSCQTKKIILEY